MRTYLIRRLLLLIPTLLIVSFITFLVVRLVPGSIIDTLAIADSGGNFEHLNDIKDAIRKNLGMDAPILTQFGRWLGVAPQMGGGYSGLFEGNLGNSLANNKPIAPIIIEKLPVTFELGILALIIAQVVALPIGIYSAIRQDTLGDYLTRSFAIICVAVPSFWVGTMVIVFPSIWWGYTPPIIYTPFLENPLRNLQMMIIPAAIEGMLMAGATMRMTRTMMLEVLKQDYIRTAWSKGLRERTVVIRHAMKNALIPVVTLIGFQLPIMVGGTVIIEQIFSLPGIGRLLVESTIGRDYTVVSAGMIVMGITIMLSNIIVDLTYGFLDPRIRFQ